MEIKKIEKLKWKKEKEIQNNVCKELEIIKSLDILFSKLAINLNSSESFQFEI